MFQCNHAKRSLGQKAKAGLSVILLLGFMLLVTASEIPAQYKPRKPMGTTQQASITVTAPTSGATWEKGKRYEISWNSSGIRGSVKIDLIDSQGKATSLTRQTLNSGKYSYTVKVNVADGDYKIRISSADGKTVGASAGTVHIEKKSRPVKKTAVAGTYQPATGVQKTGTAGVTQATGTAGTIGGTQTGTAVSAGTATREAEQLHEESGEQAVTGTVTQLGNMTAIQVPESDMQRLELPGVQGLSEDIIGHAVNAQQKTNDPTITVTRPNADDFWVAGASQPIRWNSDNLDGPVKIDLIHAVSAQQYDFYPVAASTDNDGAFEYSAPVNLGTGPHNFYLQVATLDDELKAFSPPIDVYHESIDMACDVVGLSLVDRDHNEWLEFEVWFRNNGTQPQVLVQTIQVILIKEPEELVVKQIEFGFPGITPHLWYKTPEPLRFVIRHGSWARGTTVNMEDGAYRVEVELDPLNRLGEDPALREDNRIVKRFAIR